MRTLVLLLLAFTSAMAIRQRSQFTRFKSWNSRMYPAWQDGDPRFRNCWSGGEVTFDLKNDAPTLTGAKATFTINLIFPPNQTVLPDGQVVWAHNCTVNGREYQEGQAVYPDRGNDWTGVFPDGTPFNRSQNRKPRYVFVWKTWGRYWQVADGPSSSLTIGTDDVPLGSYNMELVIYHCRGRDRFIPLGYASSVFTITDQVPFSLSLSQVNDVNQNDQNFIQNQAIAFSVALHDPSQYLSNADISFSWDFGDNSGTLISRERMVTHTYLSAGAFRPQVVLMASIPCGSPTAVAPVDTSAGPAVVVVASTPAAAPVPADGEDATALDVLASDATPVATSDDEEPATDTNTGTVEAASVAPAGVDAAVVPGEQDIAVTATEEDAAEVETDDAAEEVATVPTAAEETVEVVPAAEDGAEVDSAVETVPATDAAASAVPAADGEEVADAVAAAPTVAPVVDTSVQEAAETASVAPVVVQVEADVQTAADNVVAATATEAAAVEQAAGETEAEVLETENAVAATVAAAAAAETVTDVVDEDEAEADPAQVALVVAKRQAPAANCIINRYGSLATSVDVVQGIESVEIVQMSNVVLVATELDQNAIDVTVSCQGSLPSEVCTVISDADCITPVQTVCGAASPSPDCQMILRQFFNDTGVFCLNVSLTNDVSLAMASARVNIAVASGGSPAGTAGTVLGVMLLACVVCCIGLMYRRFKQYQPLREDLGAANGGRFVTSVPLLLWNLLSRQSPGESRPLLQGRIV